MAAEGLTGVARWKVLGDGVEVDACGVFTGLKTGKARAVVEAGRLVACKVLGRKLAMLSYHVMTKGVEFVEEGPKKAQQKSKEQSMARLERWSKKVNRAVVPMAAMEGSTCAVIRGFMGRNLARRRGDAES